MSLDEQFEAMNRPNPDDEDPASPNEIPPLDHFHDVIDNHNSEDFDPHEDDAYMLDIICPQATYDEEEDPRHDLAESAHVLSVVERMKRAQRLRRMSKRYARIREMKRTRMAPPDRLLYRARKAALMGLRLRVAGKMGQNYNDLSRQEKISIDNMVVRRFGASLSSTIQRIAQRLLPAIRRKETERVASVRVPVNEKKSHNKHFHWGRIANSGLSGDIFHDPIRPHTDGKTPTHAETDTEPEGMFDFTTLNLTDPGYARKRRRRLGDVDEAVDRVIVKRLKTGHDSPETAEGPSDVNRGNSNYAKPGLGNATGTKLGEGTVNPSILAMRPVPSNPPPGEGSHTLGSPSASGASMSSLFPETPETLEAKKKKLSEATSYLRHTMTPGGGLKLSWASRTRPRRVGPKRLHGRPVQQGEDPIAFLQRAFSRRRMRMNEEGGAGFIGTDEVVKKYVSETPGQKPFTVAPFSAETPWANKTQNSGKSEKTFEKVKDALSGKRNAVCESGPQQGKAKVKITSDGRRVSYGQAGPAKDGGPRVRPGTDKGDAYCARSLGQMRDHPKAAKDANSPLRLSRGRWKCKGSKSKSGE